MIKERYKSEFFSHFEFPVAVWQELVATLRQPTLDHEVTKEENAPFGKRYRGKGIIKAPNGRTPMLRTV